MIRGDYRHPEKEDLLWHARWDQANAPRSRKPSSHPFKQQQLVISVLVVSCMCFHMLAAKFCTPHRTLSCRKRYGIRLNDCPDGPTD